MIVDAVAGFVGELRAGGLPVSPTEHADALAALGHARLDRRDSVHDALAVTLVKRQDHIGIFEDLFELWFGSAPAPDGGPLPVPGDDQIAGLLDEVLRGGGAEAMRRLAEAAVARYGGLDAGRPSGAGYPVFATIRALDVDGALARLLAGAAGIDGSADTRLATLVSGEEMAIRSRSVRSEVEREVRRRLVDRIGRRELARSMRRPLPEDVELLHASGADMAAMRRALAPLARRMATRLARRRQHRRHGRPDVRATVRHSLSYGGVFVEPRHRQRVPSKPELLLLADVSGSVAAFARFTLEFVHAVSNQFSSVRSFVFLDGVDEVTGIFDSSRTLGEALRRVDAEADVVWADGHSDYGHALEEFWARWGREVTGRTSVVILGDARNNYHQAGDWVLGEMSRRARRVWWLNPEPRSYWDTGDSLAALYRHHCHAMVECRTLRHLEQFVAQVA